MYVNKAPSLGQGKVTRGIFLPLQGSLPFSIVLKKHLQCNSISIFVYVCIKTEIRWTI